MRLLGLLLGLSAVLGLGCQRPSSDKPNPVVLALVDGHALHAYELRRVLDAYQHKDVDAKAQVNLATSLLDNMILEQVLLAEADRLKIEVSSEEVGEQLERSARGYRAKDFSDLLHGVFLTPTMLRERVEQRLRIEFLVASQIKSPPAPSEEAMRAYYDKNQKIFHKPKQVRARQILVRTREEAEQIRERSRKTAFESLARKYSVAPEANKGGDLGFFGPDTMPPIFDSVCFSLPVDQVSEVVSSDYGFHLFQVVEVRPEETIDFDLARQGIVDDLRTAYREKAAADYIQKLRAKAVVVRHLEVLASLVQEKKSEPDDEAAGKVQKKVDAGAQPPKEN